MQLDGGEPTTRLEVAPQWCAATDPVDVIDRKLDPDLARKREQMQDRVGRAAARRHSRDRIVERAPGEDLRRTPIRVQHLQRKRSYALGRPGLLGIHLRDRIKADRREADDLHHHRHRVGRVLAAACSRSWTRDRLQLREVCVGDLARRSRSDRLVYVTDRDLLAAPRAGHDGSAVEQETGPVESGQGDRGSRNRLVAGAERYQGIEHVPPRHELDGIGDHLAADERGLHAFRSHRDSIRDRDRVELHRVCPGRPDAGLQWRRQLAQAEVARHRLEPAVRDADKRLVDVLRGEADGVKKRASTRAIAALIKSSTWEVSRRHARES